MGASYTCGCERRGSRRRSRCSSGGGSCGDRSARRACASCSGAYRSCPYPSPANQQHHNKKQHVSARRIHRRRRRGQVEIEGADVPFLPCSSQLGFGGDDCWGLAAAGRCVRRGAKPYHQFYRRKKSAAQVSGLFVREMGLRLIMLENE
jgi:hypothetical protein